MNLIITEEQEQRIINALLKENLDYCENRLSVGKYLDDHFVKGHTTGVGEDGLPADTDIVVMVSKDKKPVKSMSDRQLFYHIQNKFKDILPSDERDQFLKDTAIAWYNGKLSRNGTIVK